MLDWMLDNKVYAAYMLGALTSLLFGYLALAEASEQKADDAPDGAEVKHARRSRRARATDAA